MVEEKKSLSSGQLRVLGESLSNLGVAWFTVGLIGPVFVSKNLADILSSGFWGLFLSIIFIGFSVWILKGEK